MKLISQQSQVNELLGLHKLSSDYLTCKTYKWFNKYNPCTEARVHLLT